MSILYKSYIYASVECDMNYDKYSEGGRRYVPCTVKLNRPIAHALLPILKDYASKMLAGGGTVSLSVVSNSELSIRVYVDAMKLGYTAGEVVDRLMGVVEGYSYCTP
ncbi:MAG: hypothetical protein RXQ73_05655 [Caldivirga sp.]